MKTCTKCKNLKNLSDFYSRRSRCKECFRAEERQRYAQDPQKALNIKKKCYEKTKAAGEVYPNACVKYGITVEDYNKLLKDQGNKCAICFKSPSLKLSVDHDHVTGQVRGLLCQKCNFGIGHLKDSAINARNAIDYLKRNLSKKE